MTTDSPKSAPCAPLVIALDGPVGAGKSSIAGAVAQRLGILHLDTGAMYRAAALAVLRLGVSPEDGAAVSALFRDGRIQISASFDGKVQKTLLNGEDVSDAVRTQEAAAAASLISRYGGVRDCLIDQQRRIAGRQSIVVDGRDIGTVVFPDAAVKIFLTAAAEVRARRRWLQLKEAGQEADPDQILAQLKERDRQDTDRALHPLRQAEDAVRVDSSALDFEETVASILAIVEERHGHTQAC